MTILREFRRTKSEVSAYGTTSLGIFYEFCEIHPGDLTQTQSVQSRRDLRFLTHYLSRNYNFGVEAGVDTFFTCYRLLV